MSPKEWEEAAKPDLMVNATKRKKAILARGACEVDPALDRAVRERFKIYFTS
jgi:trimethylamine--corrinoid protein Co-methyltransferase